MQHLPPAPPAQQQLIANNPHQEAENQVPALYRSAIAYQRHGNLSSAITRYQQIQALDPGHERAAQQLTQIFLQLIANVSHPQNTREFTEAKGWLDQAKRIDPDHAELLAALRTISVELVNSGAEKLDSGNLKDATTEFRMVVDIAEENEAVQQEHFAAQVQNTQHQAINALRGIEEIHLQNAEDSLQNRRLNGAYSSWIKATRIFGETFADLGTRIANRAKQFGITRAKRLKYDRALVLFRIVLSIQPGNQEVQQKVVDVQNAIEDEGYAADYIRREKHNPRRVMSYVDR